MPMLRILHWSKITLLTSSYIQTSKTKFRILRFLSCKQPPLYIKQGSKYAINNTKKFTSPNKAKFAYFKSRFSVIKKGFRTDIAHNIVRPTRLEYNALKLTIKKILKIFDYFKPALPYSID